VNGEQRDKLHFNEGDRIQLRHPWGRAQRDEAKRWAEWADGDYYEFLPNQPILKSTPLRSASELQHDEFKAGQEDSSVMPAKRLGE